MKKIAIVYGERINSIQKTAIERLSVMLLDHTMEYPLCFPCAEKARLDEFRCIYVGTRESSSYIRERSRGDLRKPEGYRISVENETVMIEGSDDAGVLYGCVDFYNEYVVKNEYPHDPNRYISKVFEKKLPDFEYESYPRVKKRGLWTWGHVIYDYKGYIDNLVKLKMNTLVLWNDCAPINAKEIIEYAHARNVEVIWGFSWAWGINCAAVDMEKVKERKYEFFDKFEREYSELGVDGLYFQSFTEVNEEYIGGRLIAEAVMELVNETAALFFEKYPNMELQFGLHADSVRERLEYIRRVDPRIRIVWENCGSFPFSYIPKDVETFDETCEFVCKIERLRGDEERFGVVTKAFTKLDWGAFEHLQGPQYIGVSSEWMKRNREERKRKFWKYIQAYWLAYADKAQEMVRLMQREKQGDLYITALVEDGMFETQIIYPVALYAEMLWNPDADFKEMLSKVALRDYVEFA